MTRPVGSSLPGATALTSSRPKNDQAKAAAKTAQIVSIVATGSGEGGVSRISSAAGRNSRLRPGTAEATLRPARARAAHRDLRSGSDCSCPQPRIETVGTRQQLLVRAGFDDLAAAHADDAVAVAHCGETVGDDDDGAAAHDRAHVALDDALALVVERRGRFVEDEDARIGDQRAGDGDALALAAGEIGAALLDDRVVALRQLGDELVGAGEPRRLHHQRARRGGIGQRDVLVDRAVEQHVLLQHDADLAAQPGRVELGDVDAVEHHLAGVRAVEALDGLG